MLHALVFFIVPIQRWRRTTHRAFSSYFLTPFSGWIRNELTFRRIAVCATLDSIGFFGAPNLFLNFILSPLTSAIIIYFVAYFGGMRLECMFVIKQWLMLRGHTFSLVQMRVRAVVGNLTNTEIAILCALSISVDLSAAVLNSFSNLFEWLSSYW